MKTFKFVPSLCKGEDKKLNGYLMLKVPNFSERMDLQDMRSSQSIEDGKIVQEKIPVMQMIRKIVAYLKPFFIEIKLSSLDGSKVIASYDEMTEDENCHGILIEIAGQYATGLPLGNG
jgi:hypothetical protein